LADTDEGVTARVSAISFVETELPGHSCAFQMILR
jgi:hypothetical protein